MLTLALLLGLLTTLANLLGGLMVVLFRNPSPLFLVHAVGFGGGFIVATTLTEIVPEVLEGDPRGALWVLLGYLLVFLVERLLGVHSHPVPEGEPGRGHGPPPLVPVTAGVAAAVAFHVHDFLDGVAIGAGFRAEARVGMMAFLAVLAHEVPAGFAIASVLRGSGFGRGWALMGSVGIGLVTLLGIALPFLVEGAEGSRLFLGLSAGSFLYVGASLLVPATETGPARGGFLSVVAGIAASVLAGMALPAGPG